jgi:hypothetical protein
VHRNLVNAPLLHCAQDLRGERAHVQCAPPCDAGLDTSTPTNVSQGATSRRHSDAKTRTPLCSPPVGVRKMMCVPTRSAAGTASKSMAKPPRAVDKARDKDAAKSPSACVHRTRVRELWFQS